MPIALADAVQEDVVASIPTICPHWHITGIGMQQLEEGVFRLKLSVKFEGEASETPSSDELREFRDLFVSLVSFTAMVPVQLRSKGIFDSPMAGNQRKQTSLGPMNYRFPSTPLPGLQALVLGLGMKQKYASTLHFFSEALNSGHPLYRFINLAVAVELLVRHDSPVRGSRHPSCGNPKCNYELERCPKCDRAWKIPSLLRERVTFLLPTDLLSKFIEARNRVFHGLSDELHYNYAQNLTELNGALLVILRNYLGQQIGLSAISREQLSIVLNPPDIAMTVFYSLPSSTGAGESTESEKPGDGS